MNRSQVRKLAREYANGRLPREDYLRRRATLIAAITDGDVPIEREAPPAPPPPPPPQASPPAPEPAPAPARLSLAHIGVGAAVVVLVLGLVWALWPEPPAPPPRIAVPSMPMPSVKARVSGARTLVERFVAERDWSEVSIERFENRWEALPEPERNAALDAAWFRRLPRAIKDELKTQQALLEFDQAARAARTARRLLAFADRLGIGDQMPTLDLPSAEAPPLVDTATPAPATTPPASALPLADDGSSGTEVEPTASAWLAAREGGRVTLQLFAVNRLDKVASLIEAHADLDFRVLESTTGTPRYRVILGDYPDEAAARKAHGNLPVPVKAAHPAPFLKTFAELRAALRGEATSLEGTAPAPVAAETATGWVAGQPQDHFTLQLFASSSRDNVDRLVATHRDLELKVHTTTNDRSRFRVLFGAFPDEDSARSAIPGLPASVLADIGKPLIKSFSELHAITGP